MVYVNVKEALRAFESAKQQLGPRNFSIALSRSLNEAIMQGRTEARSAVKSIYNIPQRYVSGVNVFKATSVSLVAKLYASSSPIPMDAFAPRFQTATKAFSISRKGQQKTRTLKKAKSNPNAGVSIEVIKGQRQVVPYAFMIEGGKPRVFARGQYRSGNGYGFVQRNKRINKSGNDTPIKPLVSVTVHAAVINKDAIKKVQQRVSTVFPVAMERNVRFLLDRVPG